MGTSQLREHAKKVIEGLSEEKIRVAIDFLDYLREKEMDEATLEILAGKELMEQVRAAEESLRKNKGADFIPWEKVKRNV